MVGDRVFEAGRLAEELEGRAIATRYGGIDGSFVAAIHMMVGMVAAT